MQKPSLTTSLQSSFVAGDIILAGISTVAYAIKRNFARLVNKWFQCNSRILLLHKPWGINIPWCLLEKSGELSPCQLIFLHHGQGHVWESRWEVLPVPTTTLAWFILILLLHQTDVAIAKWLQICQIALQGILEEMEERGKLFIKW